MLARDAFGFVFKTYCLYTITSKIASALMLKALLKDNVASACLITATVKPKCA